jgi:hypothetical protein
MSRSSAGSSPDRVATTSLPGTSNGTPFDAQNRFISSAPRTARSAFNDPGA